VEDLIRFIRTYNEIDKKTEEAIVDRFTLEKFEKNEYILEKGKVCSKVSFIKSGLVRRYYVNEGEESTIWLYHDKHWISSQASYYLKKPSFEFLQACVETTLYSLSYENEQELLKLPQFKDFLLNFMRLSLAAFDEFHFIFETMSAGKKYQYLLDNFPLIIQKAKQMHIASLLNISQETLSRIRSAIN
jgi:CRP-like cAMP-binding protein